MYGKIIVFHRVGGSKYLDWIINYKHKYQRIYAKVIYLNYSIDNSFFIPLLYKNDLYRYIVTSF